MATLDVGGYVLAGGKSTRMGRDKALLELGGRPLVAHAVTKLRRICAEVNILSSREELTEYAPIVRDLHEGCGPMGGLEAAFAHSQHEWNLFMPVDAPFLPSAFLERWVRGVVGSKERGTRVALFTVGGVAQPLFCLLHRQVGPSVLDAMHGGRYKVFPVLEGAALDLAARQGVAPDKAFLNTIWEKSVEELGSVGANGIEPWRAISEAQRAAVHRWFSNLNTPEEFADAGLHLDALDT
jgi:molybdenum cofactor guanylyltransferase